MTAPGGELAPFTSGVFVGEIDALLRGAPATTTARVSGPGKVFAIDHDDLSRFFDDNPGVYLSFLGTRFIE